MNSEDIIRTWLEDSARGGAGWYYRHFLENGEAFYQLASKSLPQLRHFKIENETQRKDCYANSQRFAQAYPRVKYYEGFRFAGIFWDKEQSLPMTPEIAWNAVDDDMVVEWTNRTDCDVCPPLYFGVEIPVAFLERYLGKQVVLPVTDPKPGYQRLPSAVTLTLGTPLLGWYLKHDEERMA